MKTYKLLFMAAMAVICLWACKKGDAGQDGPQGDQGVQGEKGDKGDAGNANVKLYEFGSYTFTNSLNLDLSISKATIDKSLILVYFNPSPEDLTTWYPIPGAGSIGSYQTRYFIYQTSASPSTYQLSIRTMNAAGTGAYGVAVTFRKIKVIVAEASSVVSAQAKGTVDLKKYTSVKAVFHLKD